MNINYRWILGGFAGLFVFLYLLSVYFSYEPDSQNVHQLVEQQSKQHNEKLVVGYATTSMLIYTAETLLNKPGGFLSNDVLPPSVMMDNMPSFEFGALTVIRDMALSMREDFTRSQSQSVENPHFKTAVPALNIDHRSLVMPSAESEYEKAIKELYAFRAKMASSASQDAQFYARADNLADWLKKVEKRLGSLSQRLSASVGQDRLNTDMAGEEVADHSTVLPGSQQIKTSWWRLDDVFYETRGTCWALLQLLKAVEVDFKGILDKKNATVSLRQIIRELEATQQTVWSPMILNGSGFGLLANHSLVMASYVSRANAALIDLRSLLVKG